jgi:predicted ATPase/DNA-binding winged helix-turn-helix (wHTH) protein
MPPPQYLAFGPFRLDLRDERLWCGDEATPLSPKTFAALRCLVTQAGQLVTKDALLEAVWPETAVSESILTVAIRTLRRVLGDQARTPRFIETVYGRGYRFIAPVSTPVAPSGTEAEEVPRRLGSSTFSRPPHFVGRDAALAQLAQWWIMARQGTRQVVAVAGEPGIGKTTLINTFVAQVAATEDVWVGHGQCLDHYGAGEAYLPLLEALGRLGRGPEGERLVAVLRQYAPSWLVQMPGLVPPNEWESLQRTAGGATQPRMLRELTEALDVLTTARPLVLVLEDLHWSDASTLAWLAYVARRPDPARLLILGAYRPVDAIVHGHPIRTVITELTQHQQGAELPLDYLSEGEVAAYCGQRLRGPWRSEALTHVLHQRTRGHPLFLVMLVDELHRQGLLHAEATAGEIAKAVGTIRGAVPESLRQIIEQHLHHVCPDDQGLLEAASIAGRTFSAAAVAAAVDQATEDIEARLAVLAHHGQFIQAGGLVEWPDGTVAAEYSFRHDLYRDALYDRVPPSRQRRWHLQIGIRKETGYGAQAREVAAELAVHFEQGRDADRAIRYLRHAADNALRRSAYTDAITHLTKALALLSALPETPERPQRELDVQLALGPALVATKGMAAPEVEQTYARAQTLCAQVGETPQVFSALRGLCLFYQHRGTLLTARQVGEQLLRLAQREAAPPSLVEAHSTLGATLSFLGEYAAARTHLEQGIALTDLMVQRALALRQSVVPGVACLYNAARTLWYLGYPAQALQRSQAALALAQELAHHHSLAYARNFVAILHYLRRDPSAVQAQADALLTLATVQGFPAWEGVGIIYRGWALAMQGKGEAGLAQLRQGLAAMVALEQVLGQPLHLVLFAEAVGHTGQVEEGLRLLAEALTACEASGRADMLAEAYRLQGALLLRQAIPNAAQAETCFQQALAVARCQQAKSWELRTAVSLGRLWQQQGKQTEAYNLLAPISHWFTEGFDTADLQEAKVLLEELGE